MAVTLKTKNSVVTTTVPSSLAQGELAVNITDKKIWVGNASTTPVLISDYSGSIIGGSNTQVQYNSSGAFAGSANFTFNGTTVTIANDASISGLTVGKGGGAVATGTALGYQALNSNSSGTVNTAVGYQAGYTNTTNALTAVGYRAGYLYNSGSETTGSVFVGYSAGSATTTGHDNSFVGGSVATANTSGSYNTALGNSALASNTTASNNTAVGYQAGYSNTTGYSQAIFGYQAGYTNSTGVANTFIGNSAGYSATGGYNTFIGQSAGDSVSSGTKNTILGRYSGNQGGLDIRTANNYIVLSDGDGNPRQVIDGSGNVGIGGTPVSLASTKILTVTDATEARIQLQNTASGSTSADGVSLAINGTDFYVNNRENGNIITYVNGSERMRIDSSGNLLVGTTSVLNGNTKLSVYQNGPSVNCIWAQNAATNDGATKIVATTGQTTASSAHFFYDAGYNFPTSFTRAFAVRGDGVIFALNTTIQSLSDKRLKENIVDSQDGLNIIQGLRPVRFDWKKETGIEKTNQLGFIAQEVEQVFPEAVDKYSNNEDNTIEYKSVGSGAFIPVLVKAIQELNAKVTALETQLAAKG